MGQGHPRAEFADCLLIGGAAVTTCVMAPLPLAGRKGASGNTSVHYARIRARRSSHSPLLHVIAIARPAA